MDVREAQGRGIPGAGDEVDFKHGFHRAEVERLHHFENPGDLRGKDAAWPGLRFRFLLAREDLPCGDDIDALQVEPGQRDADNAVGQHEPGAGFGEAEGAGHAVFAHDGKKELRAPKFQRGQFCLAPEQPPPVEADRGLIHGDLRVFKHLIGPHPHIIQHQPLQEAQPHA